MHFQTRPIQEIVADLAGATAVTGSLWQRLAGVEIASDFIVCSAADVGRYNDLLQSDCRECSALWTVFATSGQGDLWLVHNTTERIGFYDSNIESLCLANIDVMRLDLEGWVVLADLVAQLERLDDGSAAPHAVAAAFALALRALDLDPGELPFTYC